MFAMVPPCDHTVPHQISGGKREPLDLDIHLLEIGDKPNLSLLILFSSWLAMLEQSMRGVGAGGYGGG